ncbi:hypothetical protein Poly30_51630 [Planctomycetes bacterium Poly30]|uniref:Uncharacterized protein n=1 Tax=Saltatorellus ferox TaxID=2528018 RepID=A0A518EZT7_9BACT|nr:hypothetical protein Poly30_51630 [Planctomycetes bacterium Poly30]
MKLASSLAVMAAFAPSFAAARSLVQDSCATAVPLASAVPGSPTVEGSGNPGGAVEFWVRTSLQAGESLFVLGLGQLDLGSGPADLRYEIRDDSCGAVLASGAASDAPFRIRAASPMVVRLGLRDVSGADTRAVVFWNPYVEADGCDRQQADPLEPNDSASAARSIAAGMFAGLNAGPSDPDYYLLRTEPGERLEAEVQAAYLAPSFSRAEVLLSDALTGEVLETRNLSSHQGGPVKLSFLEDGPVPRHLLLRVEVPEAFSCFGYDLDVRFISEPCSRLLEDALEGPDECGLGTVLGAGLYPDLAVFGGDSDVYELDVPLMAASATAVEITIRAPVRVPFAYVERTCGGSWRYRLTEQPDGSLRGLMQIPAGTDVRPTLQVAVPDALVDRCLAYDLELVFHPAPLGLPFCAQSIVGESQSLRLWGDDHVGSNRLWVTLDDVISSAAPLIVMAGNQRDMAPLINVFGTEIGTLCLGGAIRRAARTPANVTGVRVVGARVDLDMPALAVLQAGTTWIFQGYLTTFNGRFLTEAVAVTFR